MRISRGLLMPAAAEVRQMLHRIKLDNAARHAQLTAAAAAATGGKADQGRNSIDIFVGPESGPEPCPSHVWGFETCLNLYRDGLKYGSQVP